MSVSLMSAVWKAELPPTVKSVALALADHGNDEGYRVYPSVGLIAWKTGLSTRAVQRAIAWLVASGVLEPLSGQGGGATSVRYRMHVERLPQRLPYRTPVIESGVSGGSTATVSGAGMTQCRASPVTQTHDPSRTMKKNTTRVNGCFSKVGRTTEGDSGLEAYR